ncbi:hypothetical protein AYO47_00015 [Planctomyces sp. SCGC AG-212-M04]|nr:hypothetical protein AYO47_00015 [Planctomyces sp. SCGC AG-212-M04]
MLLRVFLPQCMWPVLNVTFAGMLASGIAASTAFGQDFGGRGSLSQGLGLGGTVSEAIVRESARVEVGITPEQQSRIDKLNEERRGQLGTVDFRSMSDDERRQHFEKMRADQELKLKSILTPEQFNRLQQISLHRAGPGVLLNEALAKEFNLTEQQKSQLNQIRNEERSGARDAFGMSTADRSKIRAEFEAKYLAVLTPVQQQQWKDRIGPAPEMLSTRTGVIHAADLENKSALWAQKSAILKEAFDEASAGQKNGRVSPLDVMQAEEQYLASTFYGVSSAEQRIAIHTKLVEIANARVELVKKNVDQGRMSQKELREAKLALIERKTAMFDAVQQRDRSSEQRLNRE